MVLRTQGREWVRIVEVWLIFDICVWKLFERGAARGFNLSDDGVERKINIAAPDLRDNLNRGRIALDS